mgnify:CR=1 FL=1
MPMKGDICDMSCQFAFACANYSERQPCKGFQLLSDGKVSGIIRQNLREYDEEYIGNCVRLIQNGCSPETEQAMVKEVYRYIEPSKKYTMRGFDKYEILSDGTLRTPEPEQPKPKIPEPLTDVQIALRQIQSDKLSDFQEILGRNFRPDEPAMHATIKGIKKLKKPYKETFNPDVGV